jgi:hypothetical protein
MVIDRLMPDYDVAERQEIEIQADATQVYWAIRETNFARSPVIAGLMLIRSIPGVVTGRVKPLTSLTLEVLKDAGFVVLADQSPREMVLGVVGRFWNPAENIERIEPEDFERYDEPTSAKAVLNFSLEQRGATCILATETRVQCTDSKARRRFLLYWRVIGPFSNLIRIIMLRMIRDHVVRHDGSQRVTVL